jgi:hypothetical protein
MLGLEIAQAIKEIGLVAVLASAIIALLWIIMKWLLRQVTHDRENFNIAVTNFANVMSEMSKVNAATASVLSDMRVSVCSFQVEERAHHQLAAVSFAKIREEHEGFKERLIDINKSIDAIEKG